MNREREGGRADTSGDDRCGGSGTLSWQRSVKPHGRRGRERARPNRPPGGRNPGAIRVHARTLL